MFNSRLLYSAFIACFALAIQPVCAQNIPAAADAGRVQTPAKKSLGAPSSKPQIENSSRRPQTSMPEGAEEIQFVLQHIQLKGASAFMTEKIAPLYEQDLGKDIELSRVWEIASEITQYYRDQGYFLSRAYVPAQEIGDSGNIVINVIEGYVGEVELEGSLKEKRIIRQMIEGLMLHKPLKSEKIESFLLQLNDLPGVSLRAVLEPLDTAADESAVKLALIKKETKGTATISYDNFGSRFLGSHQASISYDASILPLQQTQISFKGSIPIKELKQVSLRHSIPLYRGLNLEFEGSHVNAEPGHTLKINEIESKSTNLELGVRWQIIRQRLKNLTLGFKLTGKNSESDILGTPLSRDKIRAMRVNLNYDFSDRFKGYNITSLTLSQGLNFLGASKAGDLNLSRAQAKPGFFKTEVSYTRFQNIPGNWLAVGGMAGQWASGPLYSSEEFGYGGQSFGRAYDPSEITGDHGIAAMLEMRYQGIDPWHSTTIIPYAFYDIGKVWNKDAGQVNHASGSSAGLGVRLAHENGLSAGISIAQPLSRSIATPLYGNGKNPRVLFNLSYAFQP